MGKTMALSKKFYSISYLAALILGMVVAVACGQTQQTTPSTAPSAQSGPAITLSGTRIPFHGYVDVQGRGFAPMADLVSHLKKPDGTEFPFLPMLSDKNGEIKHQIDTLLLMVGTHELWIEDKKTGKVSNIAKFDVTNEQPAPAK
jgi:hypothetical protein